MNMPVVRILQPGDEPALESFLLPQVATSMFLIGNMRAAGLVDRGQAYEGTYAAAFEGQQIVAAVAHYWNGNLVTQAPAHVDALWRAAVEASQRPIWGLIGPEDQVSMVKDALSMGEAAIQLDETERLYRLALDELIVPAALTRDEVRGRRIESRDLEMVAEWRVAYGVETLGETDSPELRRQARAGTRRLMEEGCTWVLEAQGKPVATTSFNTAIQEAVQVGGVWTPPELRSRGYGRAAVAASLLDARAGGAETAILFTGRGNLPAQRAYESLGFRPLTAYRLVLWRLPVGASSKTKADP
jgi:predicted GNAT family acetyltransferase